LKILLFGDAHFCERSSIINKFGNQYTVRIENQINTFTWIKEQALKNKCDLVVGMGDFFDKSQLTDVEITAAREIPFADDLDHIFLVGNHESSTQSLAYSSTKILEGLRKKVISEPYSYCVGSVQLCFLPYITEAERKPLAEYFPKQEQVTKRIIISHNDIRGINYGPVISATGFEIDDIESNCDYYFNAHIHNGQKITDKIYNIGCITGVNFSEDASKHNHCIIILDTETFTVKFIENPYAFNFYKLQIDTEADILALEKLKPNAVCSIKCDSKLVDKARQKLEELIGQIIESRLIITKKYDEVSIDTETIDFSVDHLARFVEYCRVNIENNPILDAEISEVCR
jgi:DNA repair exonuclease SbcCD nuclease subunit